MKEEYERLANKLYALSCRLRAEETMLSIHKKMLNIERANYFRERAKKTSIEIKEIWSKMQQYDVKVKVIVTKKRIN